MRLIQLSPSPVLKRSPFQSSPRKANSLSLSPARFHGCGRALWGGPGKSLPDGTDRPRSCPAKPGLRDSPPSRHPSSPLLWRAGWVSAGGGDLPPKSPLQK